MAIRQYIGARYVPRFMGTYNASQQYEVLDVVDNGLGTSYILKNPAPAGTPVTNTNYWTIYGATSGAIINLQNQIDDINSYINGMKHRTNKKYIFIGDSWNTTLTPPGGVPITPWSSKLITILNLTNDDYYNSGVSGSGFTVGSQTFLQQLQTIANTLSADEKDEITDIIVLGGMNDNASNINDVNTAVKDFLNYCSTTFPSAITSLVIEQWSTNATIKNFIKELVQYCTVNDGLRKRARFINLQYACKMYSKYQPDGGHIGNSDYVRYLMTYLNNVLNGADACVHWDFTGSATINSAFSPMTVNFIESQNNDIHTIELDFGLAQWQSWNFSTPPTFRLGNKYIIGTLNPNLMKFTSNTVINSGVYWARRSDDHIYIAGNYNMWLDPSNNLLLTLYGSSDVGVYDAIIDYLYLQSSGSKNFNSLDC